MRCWYLEGADVGVEQEEVLATIRSWRYLAVGGASIEQEMLVF